jgi:hypothetical protein
LIGIFINSIENVGGKEMERQLQIGEGTIEVVEDDNFSVVSVRKGGRQILSELAAGTSVFIRIFKN